MKETKGWLLHRLTYVGFLATLMLLVWAISEPVAKLRRLGDNYKPLIEHLRK